MRLARSWGPRLDLPTIAWSLVAILMLAGAAATLRKSALIVPGAAILVMVLMRPRELRRIWPFGVAALIAIQFLAPSAMGQIRSQLFGSDLAENTSVQGRTQDYDAVGPDIMAKPLIGRGYGTYDPVVYRYLDNQYIMLALETGVLGLLAYLALIAAAAARGRRLMRFRRNHDLGAPLIAASIAYGAGSALFDILAFPHPVYLFLLLAGLAVAASPAEEDEEIPVLAAAAPERPAPMAPVRPFAGV
jgi:O-antigen ligase